MASFSPLFSGSTGNSYYLGTPESGILVDAGRSAKQLTEMLARVGIEPQAVQAILVTHEHTDHVSGLRVFATRHHIPVYATAGTLRELEKKGICTDQMQYTAHGMQPFCCAGFEITPFPTSHDCAEGCGYKIRYADGRTLAVATDLGYLSEEVKTQVIGCDFVIMESNHDVRMLENGSYPYALKRRILSDRGHLSNEVCADFITELAENGTSGFMLAHLSRENNTPELALQCTQYTMQAAGLKEKDFNLSVAPIENREGRTVRF